jgi:hypothetical protein
METFQKTGTHKAANDMVAAILPDRHSAEMAMIALRTAGLLSVELATKNGEVIEELGSGLGGFVGGISRFFSNRGIETMEIYKALARAGRKPGTGTLSRRAFPPRRRTHRIADA